MNLNENKINKSKKIFNVLFFLPSGKHISLKLNSETTVNEMLVQFKKKLVKLKNISKLIVLNLFIMQSRCNLKIKLKLKANFFVILLLE